MYYYILCDLNFETWVIPPFMSSIYVVTPGMEDLDHGSKMAGCGDIRGSMQSPRYQTHD